MKICPHVTDSSGEAEQTRRLKAGLLRVTKRERCKMNGNPFCSAPLNTKTKVVYFASAAFLCSALWFSHMT